MRNIEALRNYFLGKDPQLEVVLSDNSLRLSGIEGKHYILRGELIKRLTDLKTAMEDADTVLQNNIDAEALTRGQADNTLQGEIDGLNLWKDTTPFVLDSDLATALSNYYTKTQVDNLLSVIPRFSIEVVEQLPTQDISTTTIYLAPSEDPQTANSYDEFIYVNNSWEQIGSTAIDMSDYYTKEEVNAKTFINTLTQDITIPENSELNPLLLSTGWWYTGTHEIRYGEHVDPTIYNNNLFYFNAEAGDQWFYFLPPNLEDGWNQLGTYLWFDSTDHIWQYSGYGVTYTINNQSTDMQIPTAAAVHDFVINNGGLEYVDLTATASPYICNNPSDNEYFYSSTTQALNEKLEDGIYKVSGALYISGIGGVPQAFPTSFGKTPYYLVIQDEKLAIPLLQTENSGYMPAYIKNGGGVTSTVETTANKVTSISSSSTNLQYPSAKAVYDSLPTNFTGTDGVNAGTNGLVPAPATTDADKYLKSDGTWSTVQAGTTITYGTTDLTPGVSQLNEGEFYFVYE